MFEQSFFDATGRASTIRFDLTSFSLASPSAVRGVTTWELNTVLTNPSLLSRTTFFRAGQQLFWTGSSFIPGAP